MTPVEKPEAVEGFSSTYHTVHEPADGPLAVGVYRAVAEAVGIDPAAEQIPLDDCVDPDGLDEVFSEGRGAGSGKAHLVFPVWDLWVVVHGDGHIFVHPPDERAHPNVDR